MKFKSMIYMKLYNQSRWINEILGFFQIKKIKWENINLISTEKELFRQIMRLILRMLFFKSKSLRELLVKFTKDIGEN